MRGFFEWIVLIWALGAICKSIWHKLKGGHKEVSSKTKLEKRSKTES